MVSSASEDWQVSDGELQAFDVNDDDVAGRDPLDMVYDMAWAGRVREALDAAPKPMLVYCRTGAAACAMVLLRAAAARPKMKARDVHKTARSMGYDLETYTDIAQIVAATMSTKRKRIITT